MSEARQINKYCFSVLAAVVVITSLLLSGCANSDPNSTASLKSNANAAPPPPPAPVAPLEIKEPENYSLVETVNILPTGKTPQANIPTLQFVFSKMGTDRRVSFKLPEPVGEVVYLEKAPLKYLIFPARNQYVELDPQELGIPLGNLMSPASVITRLKAKSPYELMGTEIISGRPAIKYRFRGSADTRTNVGTAQAESIVFVDQETGLPLRSEIEATSSSGAGARIVTSSESVQLTPQPELFEVPINMRKVTSTELKQQVQSFVSALRVFAEYWRQQAEGTPQAGS